MSKDVVVVCFKSLRSPWGVRNVTEVHSQKTVQPVFRHLTAKLHLGWNKCFYEIIHFSYPNIFILYSYFLPIAEHKVHLRFIWRMDRGS